MRAYLRRRISSHGTEQEDREGRRDDVHRRHYLEAEIEYRTKRIKQTCVAAASAAQQHRQPSVPASVPGQRTSRATARPERATQETTAECRCGRDDGRRGATRSRDPGRARRRAGRSCAPRSASSRPSAAGQRRPARVLLAGDAGVGKTRLLTELRDRASPRAGRSLAGHCLDFGDSALPYLPFSEILGRLAAELPDVVDQVAATPPRPRPPPARPPDPLRQASDAERRRRARPGRPLRRPSTPCSRPPPPRRPLLVVVEDAHWADQSTRDLLSFLFARAVRRRRSRLVASYRSDDLHRRHPLRRQVAEWARLRGRRAPPARARCPTPTYAAWSPSSHPDPLDRGRARRHRRRAEGNAFFVEELVGAAAGAGRLACPTTSPTCCSSGSTGSTTPPARWSAPPRGRPPGLPRPARRGLRPRRRRARRRAAQGRRVNVLVPGARGLLRVPPRPARRGGLRRPAAGRAGPAPRGVRRRAARRRGRPAPPPSWPATPGWPRTSTPRSRQHRAGDEALRGRRSRRGRPPLPARRSSCSPTRARRDAARPRPAPRSSSTPPTR